ncbi:hypothetical protein F5B22DRAFT_610538 [Xylaria bambusicola]|uniref:uncharacterized protein n=1 Tax=Xylaria bambusicola TaxID=326684 RepID=UPI00200773EB|nr:uncharacterized protein F5B22DRAFT_610538 [Xylaria bambusicola]KAI0514732.1 hypothetical protein F5B22DRAFT_610538 [Xylaria bambusicola]
MASIADDVRESRRLVRVYSGDVEGRLPPGSKSQVLGQALSREKPNSESFTNPWKKFIDPPKLSNTERDPITNVITIESNKLLQKWQSFLNNCTSDDRLDVSRSEPTMEGVIDLVREISTTSRAKNQNSRRGKAMKYFHKFCETLDAHKSILKIIPEGSEYVSVFAGTLNVIIQASVNHERISEDFSEALCTISEHVADCKVELEIYHTRAMKELIADLYAHIFIFLSDVMVWITEKKRRRLLDSFNEKFIQKFEKQLSMIKQKSERIKNLAAQCSRAEQRHVRAAVEDLAQDVRLGLTGQRRQEAEMAYYAEIIERELYEGRKERQQLREDGQNFRWLADQIVKMLENKAMIWIEDSRAAGDGRRMLMTERRSPGFPSQLLVTPGGSSQALIDWTLEDILLSSKHLEDFFDRGRFRLEEDRAGPTGVSSGIIRRLSEWMKNPTSYLLWLEGPRIFADDINNPFDVLANRIIQLAEQNHIPTISYRCELRRGEQLRSGNDSREAQASMSLICALIRQLIELLLPKFQASVDLSEGRLRVLDGCILSWSETVGLFRDLLPLMPDTLLCIIDGIHWLDDSSTTGCLEELVQTMRGSKMRVLFTTTGRSTCLRQQILGDERYSVQTVDFKGTNWTLDIESLRV